MPPVPPSLPMQPGMKHHSLGITSAHLCHQPLAAKGHSQGHSQQQIHVATYCILETVMPWHVVTCKQHPSCDTVTF